MVALDHLPAAAAVVDEGGRVVAVNAAMADLAGGDPVSGLVGTLRHGEVWAAVADVCAAPSSAEASTSPCSVRHPSTGVLHHVWISAPDAQALRIVVATPVLAVPAPSPGDDAVADVGAIDLAAARAHELMGHGVIVGDGQRLLHVSAGAAELLGRSAGELMEIGSLFGLFAPGERQRLSQLVEERRSLGQDPLEHFETTVVRPDGSHMPIELWVKAKVEGDTVRTYTLLADARERRAQRDKLAHRALHDQLTGLPNRFLLMDRLATALARLDRRGGEAMLAFIDLDGFKEINDQHGHVAGDLVLRTTARRLRSGLRGCDTVARVGGDEFVILCTEAIDHQTIDVLTQRLRDLVCRPVDGDGWTVDVVASVGAVAFDDAALDADTLMAHADLAMYAAKRNRSMDPEP